MKQHDPLYIIDASIFVFRYYFSMPSNWFAENGRPTETVYGYALWLAKFLEAEAPKNVVACFDESLDTCFRNEIYPDYKISRALPDDDLAFQLLACKKITELFGVSCIASDVYEADDLAGTYAAYCHKKNKPYIILTRDKDLSQLIYSENGSLWDYPDKTPLYTQEIVEKLGVFPNQVADYLALVGDASDDIPGVPGVGKKTAIALLEHFGSWKEIKLRVDEIPELGIRGALSLHKKIKDYEEQVELALKLTTIVTNTHKVKWADTKRTAIQAEDLEPFVDQLGFPQAFKKRIK